MQYRGVLTVRYLDLEKNVQTLVFDSEWFDFSVSVWAWAQQKLKILERNGLDILDHSTVTYTKG